jgi:hypothetical protein
LKIAQIEIITHQKELSDEDEDYSKDKHNPKMPQIFPTRKLYHDQRGKSSSIGDVGRLPTSGRTTFINNSGGGRFDKGGGNGPLRSGNRTHGRPKSNTIIVGLACHG